MKKILVMILAVLFLVSIVNAETITILQDKYGNEIKDGYELNDSRIKINATITDNSLGYILFGVSDIEDIIANKFKKLCSPCKLNKNYQSSINLKEGDNYITIKEEGVNEDIYKIFVDSINPKIKKVNSGIYSNGIFNITVNEENQPIGTINYKNIDNEEYDQEEDLKCEKIEGKKELWSCSTEISNSEGQIDYYYEVSDNINSVKSKNFKAIIDSEPPSLEILFPTEGMENFRGVLFTAGTDESVKMKYELDFDGKKKNLCNSCTYTKKNLKLEPGSHSLTVYAEDLAGNIGEDTISFEVIDN